MIRKLAVTTVAATLGVSALGAGVAWSADPTDTPPELDCTLTLADFKMKAKGGLPATGTSTNRGRLRALLSCTGAEPEVSVARLVGRFDFVGNCSAVTLLAYDVQARWKKNIGNGWFERSRIPLPELELSDGAAAANWLPSGPISKWNSFDEDTPSFQGKNATISISFAGGLDLCPGNNSAPRAQGSVGSLTIP